MKKFSEFLREQNLMAPKIEEVDVVPTPQESEERLETNLDKTVREFKKTIKTPTYKEVKKMIQGDKKLSTGAIELDTTPKPKIEAPLPTPEPNTPQ